MCSFKKSCFRCWSNWCKSKIQEEDLQDEKISWVNYYDSGSTFKVNIWDIDFLNWKSYPWTQVSLSWSELWLSSLSLSGADLTWWTNDFDDIDDTYEKTDWAITWTLCTVWNKKISWNTIDWSNWSTINSNSLNVAINSVSDNSTRVYEDFTWEDRRLQSDFSTQFDSNAHLASWDLQVACSYLFYPTVDYTSTLPDTATQPDYSWSTGTRYYYRTMESWWDDHSNWIFALSWITETDISDDNIIIWVSYNGTDFYNMNEDYAWWALNNWDGCRVEPDVYALNINWQMKFSFWTWWTGSTCYIKLQIPEWSNVQLNSLRFTDWNN